MRRPFGPKILLRYVCLGLLHGRLTGMICGERMNSNMPGQYLGYGSICLMFVVQYWNVTCISVEATCWVGMSTIKIVPLCYPSRHQHHNTGREMLWKWSCHARITVRWQIALKICSGDREGS
ncbi:hypothetical protein F5Y18DRAFT_362800 [Xylariaceae sp. FL1019]|nr:hypothetical protein F5Y18DRAFT_362800 [Xylariaceae sp. FL1019]